MPQPQPLRLKTISAYHQLMKLASPAHPLISVVKFESIKELPGNGPMTLMPDYYTIALKRNFTGKMKYGQQEIDYDEGIMTCLSPGQVFRIELDPEQQLNHSGWMLLIHPDFLWNTALARSIKEYEFFDYAVNEALFLSEKEELTLINLMRSIEQEYYANIDKHSQDVMIAQIELMLTYTRRFYERQFLTRKKSNHEILVRLEEVFSSYYRGNKAPQSGLPTVSYLADQLHVSRVYLSSLLKSLTGLSAQQHIHEKLIGKAKEKLSTTSLTVSEIAYELGFEHSQSFNKLFKAKTQLSPSAFRHSFN